MLGILSFPNTQHLYEVSVHPKLVPAALDQYRELPLRVSRHSNLHECFGTMAQLLRWLVNLKLRKTGSRGRSNNHDFDSRIATGRRQSNRLVRTTHDCSGGSRSRTEHEHAPSRNDDALSCTAPEPLQLVGRPWSNRHLIPRWLYHDGEDVPERKCLTRQVRERSTIHRRRGSGWYHIGFGGDLIESTDVQPVQIEEGAIWPLCPVGKWRLGHGQGPGETDVQRSRC